MRVTECVRWGLRVHISIYVLHAGFDYVGDIALFLLSLLPFPLATIRPWCIYDTGSAYTVLYTLSIPILALHLKFY